MCLILVMISGFGMKNLYLTTSYRVFFSKENPERMAFELLENTYSKSDNVQFIIAPKNGKIFTRENLKLVQEVTEEAWQTPYSSRVDSITNFQHTEAEEDDLIVADLVSDIDSLREDDLARIQAIAMQEPLLYKSLISDRAHVTAVNITVQLPRINETEETPEVVSFVRNLKQEVMAKYPDVDVHLSGMVMMNNAFSESSKDDMMSVIPLSFGLMLVLLAVFFGSTWGFIGGIGGTVSTLVVILLSIITGLGIGGYLGLPISPPSASSPTIILTVAIANSVHILVSYYQSFSQCLNKSAALIESLRVNIQPVFIASFTTMLGFLSMNFSEVPPFRHLGIFVAIGVISSFFLSVTLLPALLSYLPITAKPQNENQSTFMTRFGSWVIDRHRTLLWSTSIAIVLLLVALPRNELNDVYVNYFDKTIEFRNDSDFLKENLTGLYNIEYSVDSGSTGGINEPQFIQDLEAFSQWLHEQPEVIHITSITDILKRLNKNMHGDDEEEYRLPDSRDLTAQYLLLYEMSLPYGLDLNNRIDIDKSSTRLTVTIDTLSSNEIIEFEQRAQEWLSANTSAIEQSNGSGTSMMFANIGQRNIKSMLLGTSVALIMISLLLIFAFKSLRFGLISLIPNLIPAAMGFGLWGILVGQIGLSLSVVSTMTMGIVIDDTVHFMSKFIRALNEKQMSAKEAVLYAFQTVGNALLITSIVLALGFLTLATSHFELNSGMGLLTSIVIVFALIADFLFLPPLLLKLEKFYGKGKAVVSPTDSAIAK